MMAEHTLVRLGKACWQPEERRLVWTKEDGSIDEAAELRLTQKQYQLLSCLYEAAPNALKSDEIIANIWGAQPISAESLPQLINKTRNALRDENKTIISYEKGAGYKLNIKSEPIQVVLNGSLVDTEKSRKFVSYSLNALIVGLTISLVLLLINGYENFLAKNQYKSMLLDAKPYPEILLETEGDIQFKFNEYRCIYRKGKNEVICEK